MNSSSIAMHLADLGLVRTGDWAEANTYGDTLTAPVALAGAL